MYRFAIVTPTKQEGQITALFNECVKAHDMSFVPFNKSALLTTAVKIDPKNGDFLRSEVQGALLHATCHNPEKASGFAQDISRGLMSILGPVALNHLSYSYER